MSAGLPAMIEECASRFPLAWAEAAASPAHRSSAQANAGIALPVFIASAK
jgi:hypothetical protein